MLPKNKTTKFKKINELFSDFQITKIKNITLE